MLGSFSQAPRAGLVAITAACALLPAGCRRTGEERRFADLVLRGAAVYTFDAPRSRAEAVAVSDGRIVWVGNDRDAEAWIGDATEVHDLPGRMVLPAFQDAHVHPLSGGVELGDCDLNPLRSSEEVLAEIARCAAAQPGPGWLRGGGFQLPLFPGGSPTAAMLDAVVPQRPVYLTSADGHSAWVNSAALELAGIDADTPDPPAGRIERDPASSKPSGTLRETAMELVARLLPARTREELMAGLRRGLEMATRFGVTALQEASADPAMVEAYAELDRRGELTARVSLSLYADPAAGVAQVPELIALRRDFQSERLRIGTVKLFVDGVVEGQTAALLEPYVGLGDWAGELNFEPPALKALAAALDAEGFQIHVHAIGDRAIRVTLDALEHVREVNGHRDSRHHLAHIQLFHPDDIPRFRELGVYANFQPLWAYADRYITELTEPFLGPDRSRSLYPIRSLVDSGATVVFGSDWSVSSMNPLLGIEVGVTRRDPSEPTSPPWIPQERVDLTTMLAGYTIEAARVNFLERDTGSIEPGKLADLVVLERDLFTVAPEAIGETAVLMTLLEGEVVYRDDEPRTRAASAGST